MKHALLMVFVISIVMLGTIYLFQRHLIYFPGKETPNPEDFHANDMTVIKVTTQDGLELNAWYKSAKGLKPTILYLHGNAGHIGHRMYLVRALLQQGFGVLLLEYRGYGGNKGSPSEKGLYEDGRAAMRFLHEHGVLASSVILYGESLGTGVATQLATEFAVCAMILQSSYTSFHSLARFHYPWLLVAPADKYDSLDRIKKVNTPLLFLHGVQDTIVPYENGQLLFEQANEPKQWVSFSEKGHNNLWDQAFIDTITLFIKEKSGSN